MTGLVILGRDIAAPLPETDLPPPPWHGRGSQLSDSCDNGGQIRVMSLDLFSQPADAVLELHIVGVGGT